MTRPSLADITQRANDDHRHVPALDGPASCTGCGWESRRTGIASTTQHDAHLEDLARKTAAPITADERAAMRALAYRLDMYYGEADAASGTLRLLDALDTAEAEVARLRAEAWDEGYTVGYVDGADDRDPDESPNPYREEADRG